MLFAKRLKKLFKKNTCILGGSDRHGDVVFEFLINFGIKKRFVFIDKIFLKGDRWLEAETVKSMSWEDKIDQSYFDKLVNDAVDHIKEFGDFEWFVSDDKVIPFDINNHVTNDGREEVPFDEDFKAMNPPA